METVKGRGDAWLTSPASHPVPCGAPNPGAAVSHEAHAASRAVVLRKFKNLRLYTWDLAQAAVIPWEVWNELAQIQTPQAKFATG